MVCSLRRGATGLSSLAINCRNPTESVSRTSTFVQYLLPSEQIKPFHASVSVNAFTKATKNIIVLKLFTWITYLSLKLERI